MYATVACISNELQKKKNTLGSINAVLKRSGNQNVNDTDLNQLHYALPYSLSFTGLFRRLCRLPVHQCEFQTYIAYSITAKGSTHMITAVTYSSNLYLNAKRAFKTSMKINGLMH